MTNENDSEDQQTTTEQPAEQPQPTPDERHDHRDDPFRSGVRQDPDRLPEPDPEIINKNRSSDEK